MEMKIRELMTTNVACCSPADSDNRAAQLMWENDCGVLPVVDPEGRTVGMVTDRDLCMAAYTKGRTLGQLSVADAMSHEVFGCKEEDSLEDALGVMRKHRVRRLPVLDGERHVVGILSLNDLALAVQNDGGLRRRIGNTLLETLGAICEHREGPPFELTPLARPEATEVPSRDLSRAPI